MSMPANRLLAYALGAVYLLVGLIGFAVTGPYGFASNEGGLLLGIFEVNILHNIAHLAIGAVLVLAAAKSLPAARSANFGVGAVYLLLGVLGPVITGTAANILALNGADHVLHLASAVALLATAAFADKKVTGRAGTGYTSTV